MVAIGTSPQNMQTEIDFGRGEKGFGFHPHRIQNAGDRIQ
jgi:hypothetical protein